MTEKQFPFTFPKEMKEKVEDIAERRKSSIAQIIRNAIQEYINKYEK